jgi:arylsulfatase A-like enzyme
MTRRHFLARSAAGAALAAGPGWLRAENEAAAPAAGRPNIVVILADDMGHGHVGCLNPRSKIPTPNIDRLAREGVTFTDAHSGSAVCSPTRYGLLTGRYAWRTRLVAGVLGPYDPPLIEKDRLTLPALLKQHGYRTACIGKWHLGWQWPREGRGEPDFAKPIAEGPVTRGFEYYFGTDVPNYPPYCFIGNDRTVGLPTAHRTEQNLDGRPGPMLPGWKFDQILPTLTERAVAWMGERAAEKQPFFLYFPLTSPHEPIAPSAAFRGKSGLNALGDFLIETDAVVGQVLDALERHGQARNTLVIFTTDNGSSLYTGGQELQRAGHEPSGQFRGHKATIYEGGHRVPFFARWPGKIAAGSQSDETLCLTDLMATCAALVGAPLPPNAAEDSYNLLPALLGERRDKPLREATVHQAGNGQLAIRQGPWKLILPHPGPGTAAPKKAAKPKAATGPELYNLADDLAETKNLHDQHPDIVERLTQLLEKYRRDGRSAPGAR